MNETKNLIKKYSRIFDFLKKTKRFENLEFELDNQKIEYGKIEILDKYYIHDNDFTITFGKINCLENKTMLYIVISKNYMNVYDEDFTFKNK